MKVVELICAGVVAANLLPIGVTGVLADETEVVSSYSDAFSLYIDGEYIEPTDVKPFREKSGRIMMPVRFFGEAFGGKVSWEAYDDTARIRLGRKKTTLVVYMSSNVLIANGDKITMDTLPQNIDGNVYLPLCYLAQGLNCSVDVDNASGRIDVTKGADDPMLESTGGMPEYLQALHDETKFCETETYTGDDMQSLLTQYFDGRIHSELFDAISYNAFYENDEIYSLNDSIYREFVDGNDGYYSRHALRQLSDDILIEFIPDENNDADNTLNITLNKSYYTLSGESGWITLTRFGFKATEHAIVKVSGIYHDNIVAPYYGADKDANFWLHYYLGDDDIPCSGTIRITTMGEHEK